MKYPGSKWNIAPRLVELIPEHHSYVEPFFGSGAVLFNKPVSDIETINDLDHDVVNLFRCIQEDAERLSRMVMTTPFSREKYEDTYKLDAWELMMPDEPYHKALRFLIQCWQGHGFRTNGYMVQIENRPAVEVIERFNYSNVFMYIDPPYVLSTRAGKQYKHEMTDADHEELLKALLQSKAKIMISGYESEMYNDYLNGWEKKQFSSCAEHGKPRMETVWMNYEPDPQMKLNFSEVLS